MDVRLVLAEAAYMLERRGGERALDLFLALRPLRPEAYELLALSRTRGPTRL